MLTYLDCCRTAKSNIEVYTSGRRSPINAVTRPHPGFVASIAQAVQRSRANDRLALSVASTVAPALHRRANNPRDIPIACLRRTPRHSHPQRAATRRTDWGGCFHDTRYASRSSPPPRSPPSPRLPRRSRSTASSRVGDSYADDGNAFELGYANPGALAIYPTRRFSGGTNYIDTLAEILSVPVENFAIGGAFGGSNNGTLCFDPFSPRHLAIVRQGASV